MAAGSIVADSQELFGVVEGGTKSGHGACESSPTDYRIALNMRCVVLGQDPSRF